MTGKILAVNIYIEKEERHQINNLISHLKELERKE